VFGGGGTAAAAASGNVSVETLDFEDVLRCLTTVDSGILTRPCRWWMNPQILVRMLSIKDGNGRPIFLTANEAPTPGGIGSILGYPVTLAHAAPSANTTSSKVAVFGDPNAQVAGVRSDFVFEASDHHRWNTLERSFRGYGRFGNKIRKATGFAVLTNAAS
jgi:HK97 family phage major capsid protein